MSKWIPTAKPITYTVTTTTERRGFLGWLARRLNLPFGYVVTHKVETMDYIQVDE